MLRFTVCLSRQTAKMWACAR